MAELAKNLTIHLSKRNFGSWKNWSTARYAETRKPSMMPSWIGWNMQVSSTIIASCTKCWHAWAEGKEARHQDRDHFLC